MWPLRRASLPPAGPAGAPPADGAVSGLLREVNELRLRLDSDFAAAAGALEAGAPEIARDVLSGQQQDLVGFEQRMLARLQGGPASEPAAQPVPQPAPPSALGRRPAASRLLPAVPLLAAAAAAAAFASGALVTPGTSPGPATTIPSRAVAASWADVHQLASQHSSAQQVLAAVLRLRTSLAPLIAAARTDPASAAQALAVLAQARALLLADSPPGAEQALATTDELVQQLTATLPPATQAPSVSSVLPRLHLAHPGQDGAGAASSSPRPASSASPSPQARRTSSQSSATPQPSSSPAPTTAPAQQPSAPQPSPSGWQWSPPAQLSS